MADQADVEAALVGLAAAVLYPQGNLAPSILNRECRVFRGWPHAAALAADLAAGAVVVSVLAQEGRQRTTTRWLEEEAVVDAPVPGLTLTVAGDAVTVGGTAAAGQLAGVLVDGLASVYRTQAGDTIERVAAALATGLRPRRVVTLAGATLAVPGAGLLLARVVADRMVRRETRRQEQGFRLTCWCPDPATRDLVAGAIDASLSGMNFVDLPDGTAGRLRFRASAVFDQQEDATLFRRDLVYAVDYATTVTTALPSMIVGVSDLAPAGAGIGQSLFG